jgi:hypothetical protein
MGAILDEMGREIRKIDWVTLSLATAVGGGVGLTLAVLDADTMAWPLSMAGVAAFVFISENRKARKGNRPLPFRITRGTIYLSLLVVVISAALFSIDAYLRPR